MATTNDIRISAPHTSIWGPIQHQKKLANGVYSVDTASHGGIMVHVSVADRYISQKAKDIIKYPEKGWWCFEEDCDWAIFAHENRDIIPEKWLPYIENALRKYYPEFLESSNKQQL